MLSANSKEFLKEKKNGRIRLTWLWILEITWNFNEGIPNAGPTTILVGHAFHLICRSGRSEHKALRKLVSAKSTTVQIYTLSLWV